MSLTLTEARARAAVVSDVSYDVDLDLTDTATFGVRTTVRFAADADTFQTVGPQIQWALLGLVALHAAAPGEVPVERSQRVRARRHRSGVGVRGREEARDVRTVEARQLAALCRTAGQLACAQGAHELAE